MRRSRHRFDGTFLYGHDDPLDLDADPLHSLAARGSPAVCSLAVRSSTVARVGLFDPRADPQADWDYWLRLAVSGASFRGVPGNVATIRRRRESESGLAGGRMAMIGLEVLEANLARHGRCPACALADQGVAAWRRAALGAAARELQNRLHLPGRAGRAVGAAIAVARKPSLAPALWSARPKRRSSRTR